MKENSTILHYVYILKCNDDTLYTGSTVDLNKRIHEHNKTKAGAKYTHARRPVKLVYSEQCDSFSESRAREAKIKRMTRECKLELVKRKNKPGK